LDHQENKQHNHLAAEKSSEIEQLYSTGAQPGMEPSIGVAGCRIIPVFTTGSNRRCDGSY